MKHTLTAVVVTLALALGGTPARAADAGRPPNVVVFLIDDLGWTDLGCCGSDLYETPHLDRLARQGMRFTHAYSACTVCSPTRAALMTGKYPARLHLTDWIAGHKPANPKLLIPAWTQHLPREEVTVAEALKAAGYATGHVGKWHLGTEAQGWPDKHGFDHNRGGYERGAPPSYFSPYKIPTLKDGPDGEYLTDRMADEAVGFLEANKDKPFFLYLPHYAVHTPLQAKKELVEKYQKKITPGLRHTNATYAAMVHGMDEAVGKVLTKLDDLKLADTTLVVFTSDNGGLLRSTSNPPLRAGKGSAYEGGVRVPLIVRWPGVTPPGSVCAEPVFTADLYPTLLQAAGAKGDPKHNANVDGESLVPLLKDAKAKLKRDAIYWHYPHYHPGGATPYGAVRAGDWRLVEFYEDMRVELYNLKDDVGEKNNLAAKMPEKADELRKRLHAWRKAVGAQMPTPNPDYKPNEEPKAARPPNIVFLLTDDQRPDTIRALGNDAIHTPHLDALVKSGTAFTRAVSPNPLCVPSRAEILTGCTGFRNGVLPGVRDKPDPDLPLWPETLKAAGYHTWYVGKWHTAGRPSTRGYTESQGLFASGKGEPPRQTDHKGREVTGYRGWVFQTDDGKPSPEKGVGLTADISARFADAAVAFIARKPDKPFFLHVNFTAPHDPLLLPPGYEKKYDPKKVPLPPNFRAEHPFDHGNRAGRDERLLPSPRTERDVRDELAAYYAVISHLDEQVGRVLAALAATGQAENTVVIFASDHGLAIGSHGLRGKQNMYEHTVGVPLVVAGPGLPKGARCDAQVYLRDLYPTACELAGVKVPAAVEGKSLVPLLRGKEKSLYPRVFGYFGDVQRMVRDDRWKLIHYPKVTKYQLFDLRDDPAELKDLADDPRRAATRDALRGHLEAWQKTVGDPLVTK